MNFYVLVFLILSVAVASSCTNESSNVTADTHAGHSNSGANTEEAVDHSKMDHTAMDHSGMQSSPGAADAPYELQFIDTMIEHHKGAVDMARLAETRASRPELKELAKKIIEDQEREIAQLRRWRDDFFAGAAPAINMDFPGMHEGMTGMDMKRLESLTGDEFDREFARQMIPHHEGAVIMAKDSLDKARAGNVGTQPTSNTAVSDPAERAKFSREFRSFAEAVVSAQESEIEQMRTWNN